MLELVVAGNDPDAARAVAREVGGVALIDDRADVELAFHTLVRATTDDPDLLAPAAEVGTWVTYQRVMRARAGVPSPDEAVVALFPMVRHPDLTHRQADDHWRHIHAPLALELHPGMSHYTQLSVVHTIHGFAYDGFALCGFESLQDCKTRFFAGPEGQQIIGDDVASFADTRNSPRRLLTRSVSTRQVSDSQSPTGV
ncbi:MAG: EthD domain-containing protein [Actinomycetia bacterium]|nr:EthD domain-containing protein [Actinomycetes bacterium]